MQRLVDRGHAVMIASVHIRSRRDQHLHDVEVAFARGPVQWRRAGFRIGYLECRATYDEKLYRLGVAAPDGLVEWCGAIRIPCVDLGAMSQQETERLCVTPTCGEMQRGRSAAVTGVDVGTLGDQHFGDLAAVGDDGVMQRRRAGLGVAGV